MDRTGAAPPGALLQGMMMRLVYWLARLGVALACLAAGPISIGLLSQGALASGASRVQSDFVIYLPRLRGGAAAAARLLIPFGSFQMGCNPANDTCKYWQVPLHPLTLSAYWIDQYEVTNGRYRACVAAGACSPPQLSQSVTRPTYYLDYEYDDYPLIAVDWFQAEAFCVWAGGHLPTEAQWERAARGDIDTRLYPWGNVADDCRRLNFLGPNGLCIGDTTPVGAYPSGVSPWGLMDMAGNVWEWVHDWFDSAYYSAYPVNAWPIDPVGPLTGKYRAVRSGSWEKDRTSTRLTRRQWSVPEGLDRSSGMRCAYSFNRSP